MNRDSWKLNFTPKAWQLREKRQNPSTILVTWSSIARRSLYPYYEGVLIWMAINVYVWLSQIKARLLLLHQSVCRCDNDLKLILKHLIIRRLIAQIFNFSVHGKKSFDLWEDETEILATKQQKVKLNLRCKKGTRTGWLGDWWQEKETKIWTTNWLI